MKLGSLFDGSGGFPLAGVLNGIEPIWASEIEPYPIAVTRSRFPSMKHFGDVSKINGAKLEPVDICTFGSPCQDMSIAGTRNGMKHSEHGAEETTRSGLFYEAVRIIREMREATDGRYPAFAVWENVPGAFSSNKGEDFRCVLEELAKIKDPDASVPGPEGGWINAGCILGKGYSIAWRVLDAQYWVPQRRKRIYLVASFDTERAGEILFKQESMRGNLVQSGEAWKTAAADAEGCTGGADKDAVTGARRWRENNSPDICEGHGVAYCIGNGQVAQLSLSDKARTLDCMHDKQIVIYDARRNGDGQTASTITGDHENRKTDYTNVCCMEKEVCLASGRDAVGTLMANASTKMWSGNQEAFSGDYTVVEKVFRKGSFGNYVQDSTCGTLRDAGGDLGGGSETLAVNCSRYIVRRLMPIECARLQGFPDAWGEIDHKTGFTAEEADFWENVRKTHAEVMGKKYKPMKPESLLKWYNKLHSDANEYKMWGNGIALPCAEFVINSIYRFMTRKE